MFSDTLEINNILFNTNIKVAITPEEQAMGLMFQPWPPPIMIFPFKKAYKKFWMKNTISPLDIVFCDNGKIIHIAKGNPLSTDLVGPEDLVDLVVELPYGFVKLFNFSTGHNVKVNYSPNTIKKISQYII